jgi:hypothetical protein
LEKLFVARQDILEDGVDRLRDAGESGRLAHVLYTGPRGSGKTHLISLIHHRATQLAGYGEIFTLAWLDEDPWGIRSFETFIEQVEAAKEHPDVALTVVFAEGFDWILKALGAEGQRRLRARIEREANLLLITSSTRLTDNLIRQARPFYGFFDHIELRPFSLDQAIDMLTRAAQYDGDEALVARLAQPDVRPRLAAIAQLAGGQPRLWALLSAGLTVSNIDDMVSLLITQFDDLTPYYQEQLRGLSATELQIVWEFVTNDRAMTPKEVAERTGISPQTVASTIKRLRPAWLEPRTGALQAFVDKRLTYYQLAEPLARVGPQLKQTRGRPVAVVVDFLAAWFSHSDLARDDAAVVTEARRVTAALAQLQHQGSAELALALPVALASLIEDRLATTSAGLMRIEIALVAARAGGGEEWLGQALDALKGVLPDETRPAQVAIAGLRARLGQADAAVQTLESAFDPGDHLTADEWNVVASALTRSNSPLAGAERDRLAAALVPQADGTDLPGRAESAARAHTSPGSSGGEVRPG